MMAVALVCLLVMSWVVPANTVLASSDALRVTIDGVEQDFDPPPMTYRGRTMLPFRAIGEALGMEVRHSSGVVYLTAPGVEARHVLRTYVITVNGEDFTFDAPSTVIEGRTLMPLRMFEPIGVNVRWDSTTRTAQILTASDYTQPADNENAKNEEGGNEDEESGNEDIERLPPPTNVRFTVTVQLESTYMESSARDKVYSGGDENENKTKPQGVQMFELWRRNTTTFRNKADTILQ